MKKFGIKLDGCEPGAEQLLVNLCSSVKIKNEKFTALEIGTAEGITTKAITEIIKKQEILDWRVISLDLVDGWSLNFDNINRIGDDLFLFSEKTDNIINLELQDLHPLQPGPIRSVGSKGLKKQFPSS